MLYNNLYPGMGVCTNYGRHNVGSSNTATTSSGGTSFSAFPIPRFSISLTV